MQVQPSAAAAAPPKEEPLSYIEWAMQGLVKKVFEIARRFFTWLGCFAAATPPPTEKLPPKIEPPAEPVLAPEPPPLPEPVSLPEATPPPVDRSFEIQLLSGLQIGSIAPPMVLRHFERYVSPAKQAKIYERLGRDAPLNLLDRYAIWRNAGAQYRSLGLAQARLNPYLVEPYLEKALTKKIGQRSA